MSSDGSTEYNVENPEPSGIVLTSVGTCIAVVAFYDRAMCFPVFFVEGEGYVSGT